MANLWLPGRDYVEKDPAKAYRISESFYANTLQRGEEFQDFVTDWLRIHEGIILQTYSSRKYQYEVGETACGAEIKLDEVLARTGKLYIELGERKATDIPYTNSGIYRQDNSRVLIIGNFDQFFLFGKFHLRYICEHPELHKKLGITIQENDKKTSIGMLYPVKIAVKEFGCATKCIRFKVNEAAVTEFDKKFNIVEEE